MLQTYANRLFGRLPVDDEDSEQLAAAFEEQAKHLSTIREIILQRDEDWPIINEMLSVMGRSVVEDKTKAVENLVDLAVFGVPTPCPNCQGEVRFSAQQERYFCVNNPLLDDGESREDRCSFSEPNPSRVTFVMPKEFRKKLPWFPFSEIRTRPFQFRAYGDADVHREYKTVGGRMLMKRGTVVDPQFPRASECHLLKGDDGGLCSAVLVYVDSRADTNNYTKIQLYEHDVKTVAYLYVSYGRIGADKCVVDRHKFKKRDKAVKRFEELFMEYTDNEWSARKIFVPKPGMFMYLEMDYTSCKKQLYDKLGVGESRLQPEVQNIVEIMYAGESSNVRTTVFNLDMELIPMGPVAKKHIAEAKEVLSDLEQILDCSRPNMSKVFEATSRFYTLVPCSFGSDRMTAIDSLEILVEKSSMLAALDDVTYEFVITNEPAKNPNLNVANAYQLAGLTTEQLYQRLKCDISVVDYDSDDFRTIQQYLHNTGNGSGLRLVDLFRLRRHQEHVTFRSSLGNRLLLWHGTNIVNFPSILTVGLKITPPASVQRTGAAYGRGVYFADTADKSQGYCRAYDDHFFLLCDVALGRIQYAEWNPTVGNTVNVKDFDSYLGGTGTLAEPAKVIQHPDGYGIPIHTVRQQTPNEYIVFNANQVSLKYMVRARCWRGVP